MEWSKDPETTVQKSDGNYVLVPEVNYRNYKTFEAMIPEYQKALSTGAHPQANTDAMKSNLLWCVLGIAAGAITMSRILR